MSLELYGALRENNNNEQQMYILNIFSVRWCNLRENGLYNFILNFRIYLLVPLLTTSKVLMSLELSGALRKNNNNNNKCLFDVYFILNNFSVRWCNLRENGLFNFILNSRIYLLVPLLTTLVKSSRLLNYLGPSEKNINNNKCVFWSFSLHGNAIWGKTDYIILF